MIYDILEAKLAAAGFEPGEALFRNEMPDGVEQGILIRSPLTGIPIDPFIPGWHKAQLQIVCRHTDPVELMALARQAQVILTVEGRQTYSASEERGPAHLDLFIPETLPIIFPRLEGNTFETSQRFNAVFGFLPA